MAIINFSPEEQEIIVNEIRAYHDIELEVELGHFDAVRLLDFLSEKIGPYYYNRGLFDAQAILESRMDNIKEAIGEIEKITEFVR